MKTNSMKSVKRLIALSLSILIACPYAYAQDIGKITYVEGRVDTQHPGSEFATPLREGDTIAVGDAVRTKSNSKAEVTFSDKSVLRLAQNTRIEVKDYQLDANNKRKAADIMLDRGKARTIIAKMPGKADFVISTPNAKGTVKGSDIFVFYQAGSSGMLVAEGQLSIVNPAHPKDELIIPAGNSVVVPLDDSPKGPRAYLDLEKKLHEEDTSVPANVIRSTATSVIKGVLVKMSGDVKIASKGVEASRKASINDIVGEGDTIETGNNGLVEIRFDNGNGITLKANTKITITKLVQDPKTGQYENKFETSMGKVRSRIEKLKETKSTFEIRTPTAICGARATIMYVNVSPMMTKVFFEGGSGYILNMISGINQTVGMAQSAYAGANGEVGDPMNPSDDDRAGFTEGWDQGNGTEGYSSPDAGSNYVLGQNFADNNNDDTLDMGLDTGLTGGFSYVPFGNGIIAGGTEILLETTSFDITFSGEFGAIDKRSKHWYEPKRPYFSPDSGAPVSASITAGRLMPLAWWGILSSTVSGTFSNGEGLNFCRGTVQGTTSEGGTIFGWAGGTGFDKGYWKGVASSLYVDPTGRAGVIFGHMAGDTQETGAFSGIGDLFIIPMKTFDLSGTTPEDLIASRETITVNGNFDTKFSGGFLKAPFTREKMSIAGERWGIWQDVYKGDYRNQNGLGNWLSYEGGKYEYDHDQHGYFISTFEGADDLNGGLVVDIMTTYMDHKTLGAYAGTILGRYGEYSKHSDNLEGLGFGTWSESELAWSTDIDAKYNEYKYYEEEYYEHKKKHTRIINEVQDRGSSSNSGIIGALASPFESLNTYVPIVLIGKANAEGLKTWWGRIDDKSYAGDGSVMPRGIIGGSISTSSDSKLNDIVKGALAFLYIDKDGNAGTLTGDFSGTYIDDIDMWIATGGMKATERATGYNPAHYHVEENEIQGYFNGSFAGGGSISNSANICDISKGYVDSKTYSLKRTYSGTAESWGIYGMELGGSYVIPETPTNNWKLAMGGDSWAIDEDQGSGRNRHHVNDYWLATVKGEQWSNGQLKGSMNGVWFASAGDGKVKAGTIKGKTVGDYIEVGGVSGTWSAISAGEWVEVTELLDQTKMFGAEGLSALDKFVSVPITEVYSNILTGANAAMNANMNIALYQNQYANIWTALFSGNYTANPGSGWNLQVGSGSDIVDLQNGTWINGTWTADVNGTVDGNTTTGQAGGTYGDGDWQGVGAGIWTPPPAT